MALAFALDHRHERPPVELAGLLGAKGAALAEVTALGLPVPPGFTITVEACRAVRAGTWPAGLDDEVARQLVGLGERCGARYGDPAAPLVVSVRSGAPVSLPGALATVVDVGLDDATAEGLARATGDGAFVADCRRRLAASFAAVGRDVPATAAGQLRAAVEAVAASWDGPRAVALRRLEGVDDRLGTAVTVQAMAFGNRDARSGSGVAFSRSPVTGEPGPFGDFTVGAQGDDVVGGGGAPSPLATLATALPDVYGQLVAALRRLEVWARDVVEVELTVEQGRLWVLQARVGRRTPAAAARIAVDLVADPEVGLSPAEALDRLPAGLLDGGAWSAAVAGPAGPVLAEGVPASPGVGVGVACFDPDRALALVEAGQPVVLVRDETSPGDVPALAEVAGVLTARGGVASHAAVMARSWGTPAVCGATGLAVGAWSCTGPGGVVVREGEVVSVDGTAGRAHVGAVEAVALPEPPELAVLSSWAAELAGGRSDVR